MGRTTLLVKKTTKTSKSNWISIQDLAGLAEPDQARTSFKLSIDSVDLDLWQAEIKDHGCTYTVQDDPKAAKRKSNAPATTAPMTLDFSEKVTEQNPTYTQDNFHLDDNIVQASKAPRQTNTHPLKTGEEPGEIQMRRRLTSATLSSRQNVRVGALAGDIAAKILGRGASDTEVVTASRQLLKALGPKGVTALHEQASRIAAELGEEAFTELDAEDGQPDPRNTQDYVAEHEVTPDHGVLDVVLHEQSPTQDPTAAKRRKAAEEDKEDEEEPEMADPEDVEDSEETEDHVEEETEDEVEDAEASDEDESEDESEEESDDEESEDSDEDDLDAFLDSDEGDGGSGEDTTEDYYAEDGEDDGKFTLEDMEELEAIGVDGVLTSSRKNRKAGKTAKKGFRPPRTRIAGVNADEFASVFDAPDVSSEFR